MAHDPILPGPIRQTAHVVPDVGAEIGRWLAVGVGPWFVLPAAPQAMRYRDATVEPVLTIAFASSGALQVELIAPGDDVPSPYRDFLAAGHEGLHHHAWWTDDYDAAVGRVRAAGWTEVASGDGGGSARFCYLEPSGAPGTVVEVMELTDTSRWFMDHVRDAALDWDGTDPIR